MLIIWKFPKYLGPHATHVFETPGLGSRVKPNAFFSSGAAIFK